MINHWTTTRADAQGNLWRFLYTGGSFVRIGPDVDAHWTNSIQLDDYGLKPETVTAEWLSDRAVEWIADYNADVAAGNLP